MKTNRANMYQNIDCLLITGAGGYLGGEIIRQLIETTNCQIIALSSQKEKVLSRFDKAPRFSCYNLQQWESREVPWDEINVLIHCAFARTSSGQETARSLDFTAKIFAEADENQVQALINVSSQGVYGGFYQPPWSEKTQVAPNTLYKLAKYSSELLCLATKNIPFKTNLRLASLTGGAEGLTFEVISKFVNHAIKNETIRIIGGKQIFSYLDVRDAAAGIITLLSVNPHKWKPVYNLGSNVQYNIVQLAYLVSEVAKGFTENTINIEIEEQEIHLQAGMDSDLFYQDTMWTTQYEMKETIKSLFQYLLQKKVLNSGGSVCS